MRFDHAHGDDDARGECQYGNEAHRRLHAQRVGHDAGEQGADRVSEIAPQAIMAAVQFPASALAIAARSFGSSGVTSLGKNATTLPCLSITYFAKFHAGR